MKPRLDDKKCGAIQSACKAITACPVGAISYIEVEEPITDRSVECSSDSSGSGCSCDCDCVGNSNGCGGTPYGRITIDYDSCIECGVCADECCGTAIDMID